jgi:hypothetical protein
LKERLVFCMLIEGPTVLCMLIKGTTCFVHAY